MLATSMQTVAAASDSRLVQLEQGMKRSLEQPITAKSKRNRHELEVLSKIQQAAQTSLPGETFVDWCDRVCALVKARMEIITVADLYGWDVAECCILRCCLVFVVLFFAVCQAAVVLVLWVPHFTLVKLRDRLFDSVKMLILRGQGCSQPS
jgi:hypothetical protein